MAPAPKHRLAILAAAARLFRRQGYAATGLAEIVAESGAPKGSVYHYFPGGKAQIGVAAVGFAGDLVTTTLRDLAAKSPTPDALIRAYAALLAGWMEQSAWQAGCPVATVLLETAPGDSAMAEAGRATFQGWAEILTQGMIAAGVPQARALHLGRFAIAAIEGALILARVEQSPAAILAAGEEVGALVAQACLTPP